MEDIKNLKIEEDDGDDEIENLMCDAQDAYFEQQYDRVIQLTEKVLEKRARDSSAHELMVNCFLIREDYERAFSQLEIWEKKCGETTSQLYHTLKAAYMLENIDKIEETLSKFMFLLRETEEEDMWLRGIVLGVAYCADLGLGVDEETTSMVLDEKHKISFPILQAWIDCCRPEGNLKKGLQVLMDIACDPNHEDAPLAISLMDLFFHEQKELVLECLDIKEKVSKLVEDYKDSFEVRCVSSIKASNKEELRNFNTISLHHFFKKRIFHILKEKKNQIETKKLF